MTEHKFTDEKVIRALECLLSNDYTCDASYCDDCGECLDKALQDALDLINRQKAEIKKLKDLNSQLETDIINANMNLEHITYEFDLLKQEKSVVVAEAVKEFAERLKTYYRNLDKTAGALVEYHIDEIVKEMLEGG